MKIKGIILGLIIALAINTVDAQVNPTPECLKKWGATAEDSMLSRRTYFYYQTAFENKDYEKAYNYWQLIYTKVPCARNDIYIDAPELFDTLIAREDGPVRKQLLLDSLYLSFGQRIKHFGKSGFVKGKWALSAAHHQPKAPEVAYKLFQESIDAEGNKTGYDIPSEAMYNIYLMLGYKKIEREQAIQDYLTLNDICKANIALHNDEEEDWLAVSAYIDQLAGKIMTCEQISEIFGPKLKESPDNADLKKTTLTLLKAKRCVSNPLYIQVLSELITTDPNEEGYAELANYYLINKKYGEASNYLEKAVENAEDALSKEKYYLQLAGINQCGKARQYADKVLEINPKNGKAIMIKGHAVYNCNIGSCEGYWAKAMSWVAVDYMIRAKAADPSVAEAANKAISQYRSRFPNTEEKFFQGHKDGQSITIPCNGITTTVR